MEVCHPAQCQANHRRFRSLYRPEAWDPGGLQCLSSGCLTVQAFRFPASLSSLPDPIPPRFPRGVGPPALAFPLSPRQDLGAVVPAFPDPAARGCWLSGGRPPWACSERAGPGGGWVGEEEEEGAVAAAVRSRARAELRSLLPAGARPCPQVAGSRAPPPPARSPLRLPSGRGRL